MAEKKKNFNIKKKKLYYNSSNESCLIAQYLDPCPRACNFFANVVLRCQGPKFTLTQPTYLNELSQMMYAKELDKKNLFSHTHEGKIVFLWSNKTNISLTYGSHTTHISVRHWSHETRAYKILFTSGLHRFLVKDR